VIEFYSGCITWSLTLMKDHKLWLCEDSADNETEIKSQVNEHNELIV